MLASKYVRGGNRRPEKIGLTLIPLLSGLLSTT